MGDAGDGFFQGSTKKILSMVKNLPDKGKIEATLRGVTPKREKSDVVKRRRFNRHPRRIVEPKKNLEADSWESFSGSKQLVVIKKPQVVLTDSSDEYCDVTIRKDDIAMLEDDDIDIEDSILNDVQARMKNSKYAVDKLYYQREKEEDTSGEFETSKPKSKLCGTGAIKKRSAAVNDTGAIKKEPKEQKVKRDKKEKAVDFSETSDFDRRETENTETEKSTNEDSMENKDDIKFYIDKKLSGIIDKSTQSLQEIRSMMELGVDPPDGTEEYERKKKRANEFSSRFARIHLYELNRHVSDLHQGLKSGSQRSTLLGMNQKYFTAHQTIFQGLQAYHKHLPTSIAVGVPDKLKELLKNACTLCDIFQSNSNPNSPNAHVIEVFHDNCKELLEDLEETTFRSSTKSGMLQQTRSRMSLGNKDGKAKKKTIDQLSDKLSMYHRVPMRKDIYWKKAVAALAEKKFNVPSRYKTATYKHRPAVSHPAPPLPIPEKPVNRIKTTQGKFFEKRQSRPKCRSAKPTFNDIDNNVTTLVQAQEEKDRRESMVTVTSSNSPMWNMAQGFFRKIAKDNQDMTQSEYECILEHFMSVVQGSDENASAISRSDGVHLEDVAQELLEQKLGKPLEDMEFKEFVDKLIECANENNAGIGGNENKDMHAVDGQEGLSSTCESDGNFSVKSNSSEVKKTLSRSYTMHVTGSKNAKLYCMKDENSLLDRSNEEKKSLATNSMKLPSRTKSISTPKLNSGKSGSQLIYREKSGDACMIGKKLARIHKSGLRQLTMLPKDIVVNVIEYKLEIHKQTKNNYMYKKMGDKSAWILMDKISEKLMEEALQSIARDIQVDEILRKLYTNEFK